MLRRTLYPLNRRIVSKPANSHKEANDKLAASSKNWGLRSMFGYAERTPLPPKPFHYDKTQSNMALYEESWAEKVAGVDPESPHWRDPKFESKPKQGFFDTIGFGYNRDWSRTLWRLSFFIFFVIFYNEYIRGWELMGEMMRQRVREVSPIADYARDEVATEKELRDNGFTFVGVVRLDNLGNEKSEDAEK